ncbi:MAG TPA: GGDEF domain-containing protein, partial [Burkholderiaceae bacterium]
NDLAERDELTGVYNRRKVLQTAEQRGAQGVVPPFCLCLFDLDHFKSINDTYGHAAGDAVLRAFAQTVQREVRAGDCFGRYGGEEFLLLLDGADMAVAMALAERIRVRVEALQIPQLKAGRKVTLSAGIAQYAPGEAVAQAIARADKALYAAKHGGRNRVNAAPGGSLRAAPV